MRGARYQGRAAPTCVSPRRNGSVLAARACEIVDPTSVLEDTPIAERGCIALPLPAAVRNSDLAVRPMHSRRLIAGTPGRTRARGARVKEYFLAE
jgi:hypothetical protein